MLSRLRRLLCLSALGVLSLASSTDAQTRVRPKAPRLQRARPPTLRPMVPLVRINVTRPQPRLTSLTTVVGHKGRLEAAGEGGFRSSSDDDTPPPEHRPPPTDRGGEDPPHGDPPPADPPPDDDRPPPTDRGGEEPPPAERGGDDDAADGEGEGSSADEGAETTAPNVLGTTAEQLRRALTSADLSTAETGTFGVGAQTEVVAVLTRTAWGGVGESVQPALLSPRNEAAKSEVRKLLRHVEGLLLEPHRVRDAVLAFNGFVEASSDEFLSDPPEEFQILYATLAALTDAAYEELAAVSRASASKP